MQTTDNIRALFEKYISGMITPVEVEQLVEIADQYSNDELADILEPVAMSSEKGPHFKLEDWEPVISSILSQRPERKAKVIFTNWYRVAAAAIIVLVLSAGGYFFLNKNSEKQIAKTGTQQRFKNDVAPPGKAKAMITLANGRIVSLDNVANGTLATQGNVNVVKKANGEIVYSSESGVRRQSIQYNTLSNPKGSKVIDMTLGDGSRIWLNAESSVTYPVAFVGNERKVEMTGEAYFEVAPLTTKGGQSKVPFLVESNGVTTEVLGTHFNVNAYGDDANIKVTLLEGAVKISNSGSSELLKPGQQAVATGNGQLTISNNVDLDEVVAWKNGKFQFNDATIESIMHDVERWYDVEIVYKRKTNYHFVGSLPSHVPVSKLLNMLELTGRVSFLIEGKKITVME